MKIHRPCVRKTKCILQRKGSKLEHDNSCRHVVKNSNGRRSLTCRKDHETRKSAPPPTPVRLRSLALGGLQRDAPKAAHVGPVAPHSPSASTIPGSPAPHSPNASEGRGRPTSRSRSRSRAGSRGVAPEHRDGDPFPPLGLTHKWSATKDALRSGPAGSVERGSARSRSRSRAGSRGVAPEHRDGDPFPLGLTHKWSATKDALRSGPVGSVERGSARSAPSEKSSEPLASVDVSGISGFGNLQGGAQSSSRPSASARGAFADQGEIVDISDSGEETFARKAHERIKRGKGFGQLSKLLHSHAEKRVRSPKGAEELHSFSKLRGPRDERLSRLGERTPKLWKGRAKLLSRLRSMRSTRTNDPMILPSSIHRDSDSQGEKMAREVSFADATKELFADDPVKLPGDVRQESDVQLEKKVKRVSFANDPASA
jgi:hypothetical protein